MRQPYVDPVRSSRIRRHYRLQGIGAATRHAEAQDVGRARKRPAEP